MEEESNLKKYLDAEGLDEAMRWFYSREITTYLSYLLLVECLRYFEG